MAIAALAGLLVLGACGLDEVEVPDLAGPSTTGIGLLVKVNPDTLLADAVSTAVVQAVVRGPNGQPLSGRAVFFAVADENGAYVDLGTLQSTTAPVPFPAPQVTEVTDGNGAARVVYRVPERISVTAIQFVHILARVVGDDRNAFSTHSVLVELRPAEVRRYPENPNNAAPTCTVKQDPEVGPINGAFPTHFTIRFRTSSSDEDGQIIRYFWDFDDGASSDKPDTEHHWTGAGVYTVTHIVTDNNGAIGTCSTVISVVP